FLLELNHVRRELDGNLENGTVSVSGAIPSDRSCHYDNVGETAMNDKVGIHLTREEDAPTRLFVQPAPSHSNLRPSIEPPLVHGSLDKALEESVISDPIFEQIV